MKTDVEMTFGEHLEELRRRLIRALLGLVVASLVCGYFYSELFNILARPFEKASQALADRLEKKHAGVGENGTPVEIPKDVQRQIEKFRNPRIISGGPTTPFNVIIVLCLAVGTFIASPWVIYQAWAFVGVGLHPHERKAVYRYTPFSFLLFFAGAVTFYFISTILLEALMSLGLEFRAFEPTYTLDEYLRFIAWMTIIFGVAFQTPLVVLFLARTGIVPLQTLFRQQRAVILVMAILGAVLSPGGDPISMTALAAPLILLYEFGLLLSWLSLRRKRREEDQEDQKYQEAGD
jgi:Tat protein translocase TatC